MLKKECFPNRSIVSSLKTWEPKIQIIKLKLFMYAEKKSKAIDKIKNFLNYFCKLDSSGSAYISIQNRSLKWWYNTEADIYFNTYPILKYYRVKHKGCDCKDDFKL